MDLDADQIEQSFAAISPRLDELTMLFYADLFTSHPEVKPLFGGVDLVRQRRKLAAMLTLIVTNIHRMDVLISALRSLGARHIGYGATEQSYEWTEAALLRSLEQVAGEGWDERTARAWAGAISLVSNEMMEGASRTGSAMNGTEASQSDDLDVLMEIAANPSLSFRRNSLFSSYVDKKKNDHEMILARSVQQSLVPPRMPSVPGYAFSATYEPATHVGGDYYDWVMPDDEHVCFIVGDVSGKGVPGALIMCRLAGAARTLLALESDVTRAINAINVHMCDRMTGGRFVTLAFLGLHLPEHRYTLVSAGHLPLIHRRADGATAFVGADAAGIPVGIDETAAYRAVNGIIEPGDAFVLYTDGISEAMRLDGAQYGMERMRDCVAAVREPAEIGAVLLEDVRRFVRGRPQSDDLTIVTVARLGGGGPSA